jgi:hypothetical protein
MNPKQTFIPILLLTAGLAWLNHGLHTQLAPPTLERLTLPYADGFERTQTKDNPQPWNKLSGDWNLKDGFLEPSTLSASLQWRGSVTPRTPYLLELTLELPNGLLGQTGKASLMFNAQTLGQAARSQRISLERRDRDVLIRAEYINKSGEAKLEDERLVFHPEARLRLRLQVVNRAYAIRLDGEPVLAALPLKFDGGLIGLQAAGPVGLHSAGSNPVRFDELSIHPADGDAIAADRLGLASSRRVPSGWRELSGLWAVEGIGLTQRDRRDFDRTLMLERKRNPERIRLSFRHLAGSGAGLIFNAPADSLEAAHLVRYAEDGKSLFWGAFKNGKLKGQGYAPVANPGLTTHTLEVLLQVQQYTVKLDGKTLGTGKLERQNGRIGLTTSQSAAAFTGLELTESGKRKVVLP